MNLSDLVLLKHRLTGTSALEIREQTDIVDGKLSSILSIPMHADYQDNINELIRSLDRLEQEVFIIENKIPAIINKIDAELNERTAQFDRRGYTINGEYASGKADVYTEREIRKLPVADETRAEIIMQIKTRTDWHYPALEIGPGDGEWTDHMVAADPLYIVDIHAEFLQATKSKFNSIYQSRLRSYLTGEQAKRDDFDLGMLPAGQFGFIFSWNVFNYFPMFETESMLSQCFTLLRPGGRMIFSFNDCEIPKCAEHAETGFRSWMPKAKLISICKKIGFEIITYEHPEEAVCWLEIKKPGTLTTIKSHPVLGKIITA